MSKTLLGAAAALSLATAGAYALQAGGAEALEGDAAAGAAVFKKCQPCHSIEPNGTKVGPSLYGVLGRTPGTLEGYKYSPAMIAFGAGGAVWDEATLDHYLVAPKDLVPKTKMIFPGVPAPQDRANLIAYLESLVSGGATQ